MKKIKSNHLNWQCSVNDTQVLRILQVWSDLTNSTNAFKPRIQFATLLLSPNH